MKYDKDTCCLITKNHEGKLTVFTKKQFELKSRQRPELREENILERVQQTIEKPSFIYEDYEDPVNRLACYLFEYKINSRSRYMKVILRNYPSYLFVITAYRPDYVKERTKIRSYSMEKTMNSQKLIEAIKEVPLAAERDGWVFTFDAEEGALFYAPQVVPMNATLHQVTDEYAVYLDDNLKPHGVVVEYYKANFLKHHEIFNKIDAKIFTVSSKHPVVVVDPKSNKEEAVTIFKALFENNLIKEAGTGMVLA